MLQAAVKGETRNPSVKTISSISRKVWNDDNGKTSDFKANTAGSFVMGGGKQTNKLWERTSWLLDVKHHYSVYEGISKSFWTGSIMK
jgi:hypothetical protein